MLKITLKILHVQQRKLFVFVSSQWRTKILDFSYPVRGIYILPLHSGPELPETVQKTIIKKILILEKKL